MEQQIHCCKLGWTLCQLDTANPIAYLSVTLSASQATVMAFNVIAGHDQEPTGPAGRIANGVIRGWLDAVDHRPDHLPRREVLSRSRGKILSDLCEQLLIDGALDFHTRAEQPLRVQIRDQLLELGRVQDLVASRPEDHGYRIPAPPELLQDTVVFLDHILTVEAEEELPCTAK